MNKISVLVFLLFIFGCASHPSFKKSNIEMHQVLINKSVCCEYFDNLTYTKVIKIPGKEKYLINEVNQVMVFEGEKSYTLALELPKIEKNIKLKFASLSTWSHVEKGGYFSPVVRLLDEKFITLSMHSGFVYDSNALLTFGGWGFQISGITGEIEISPRVKYVLFYTNKEEMGRKTAFYWDGMSSYNVPDLNNITNYRGLYIKPHLPEGELVIIFDDNVSKNKS